MDIGQRIAERRRQLNMTQEELAYKMGYKTKSSINKIELGVQDVPQKKIVRFAEVLDTTINYLMGWEDPDPVITDAELMEYLEYLRTRPEARILMSTVRGATKEEVEENVRFIEALRKSRHGTD